MAPAIDFSKDYAGVEAEKPIIDLTKTAKAFNALAQTELGGLLKKVKAVGSGDSDIRKLYQDLVGNRVIQLAAQQGLDFNTHVHKAEIDALTEAVIACKELSAVQKGLVCLNFAAYSQDVRHMLESLRFIASEYSEKLSKMTDVSEQSSTSLLLEQLD